MSNLDMLWFMTGVQAGAAASLIIVLSVFWCQLWERRK